MLFSERVKILESETFETVGSVSHHGFKKTIREIFQYRELLGLLVRRDLKSKFKDSSLGLIWTLVRPLTLLVIYYVVIGQFLGAERNIPSFSIYVFIGITAYGLFSEMVSSGTASIVTNAGLVKKVYLPREVFPLAAVGGSLFTFAVQLGILLIFTLITGQFPLNLNVLYFFPGVLVLLVFGTALALLLAAVNVHLRDVQYLVEVLLLLLLWASPILYGWEMVRSHIGNSIWLEIFTNNPITLAILAFQKAFWVAGANTAAYPDFLLLRLGIALVAGLVLLYFAQRVFSKLQGNFAQTL